MSFGASPLLQLLLLTFLIIFKSSNMQQVSLEAYNGNQRNADPSSKFWSTAVDMRKQYVKPLESVVKSTKAMQSILTLLESLGYDQKRREEVEIGRVRAVNVLGMPVGRKDGISLAPLRGLSVGNEDMFGPIAINDKYNINWGFFNDLSKIFNKVLQ